MYFSQPSDLSFPYTESLLSRYLSLVVLVLILQEANQMQLNNR